MSKVEKINPFFQYRYNFIPTFINCSSGFGSLNVSNNPDMVMEIVLVFSVYRSSPSCIPKVTLYHGVQYCSVLARHSS